MSIFFEHQEKLAEVIKENNIFIGIDLMKMFFN